MISQRFRPVFYSGMLVIIVHVLAFALFVTW